MIFPLGKFQISCKEPTLCESLSHLERLGHLDVMMRVLEVYFRKDIKKKLTVEVQLLDPQEVPPDNASDNGEFAWSALRQIQIANRETTETNITLWSALFFHELVHVLDFAFSNTSSHPLRAYTPPGTTRRLRERFPGNWLLERKAHLCETVFLRVMEILSKRTIKKNSIDSLLEGAFRSQEQANVFTVLLEQEAYIAVNDFTYQSLPLASAQDVLGTPSSKALRSQIEREVTVVLVHCNAVLAK